MAFKTDVKCIKCGKYGKADQENCAHCGYKFPAKVIVMDVNMPFLSMVLFMINWALAIIPALFILFIFVA
ncbi:MAG TPA: hypothetical protein ACFYDZ_10405 [Candidatus Brocadiaceae bacterium]